MTRLRIRDLDIAITRVDDLSYDVKPDDGLACLLILRNEVEARGLGDWHRFRIEAWDSYAGWVEHRPQ